jgi:hypothetical protein
MGKTQMNNQSKEILGASAAAIGTISAAVGSTPSYFMKSDLQEHLVLWGNVLQATGNALEADGQENISLEGLGNQVQSAGNVTVISGLMSHMEEETKQKLVISGNWMQALGALVSLADELEDDTGAGRAYAIIGNLLQATGNSLQAFAGIKELEDQLSYRNSTAHQSPAFLDATGSWIQALGSVLSLLGQIKEENKFNTR